MKIEFKEPMVSISKSQFDATIAEAKAEVAREIFAEIEKMCIDTFGNFNHRVFAKLKKKYTEGTCSKKELVEVVRCKDCKHCEIFYIAKHLGIESVKNFYCNLAKGSRFETDFCSFGERKE